MIYVFIYAKEEKEERKQKKERKAGLMYMNT